MGLKRRCTRGVRVLRPVVRRASWQPLETQLDAFHQVSKSVRYTLSTYRYISTYGSLHNRHRKGFRGFNEIVCCIRAQQPRFNNRQAEHLDSYNLHTQHIYSFSHLYNGSRARLEKPKQVGRGKSAGGCCEVFSHSLSPLIGKKLLSMFSLSHHHITPYLLPDKIAVSPGWINLRSSGTELGGREGERYFGDLGRKVFLLSVKRRGVSDGDCK